MIASASSSTNTGTIIAVCTLAVMFIPIYVMTLKASNSYGRLEQKVDTLTLQQVATAAQNAKTAELLAATVSELTSQFQKHAVEDASNFGEMRGILTGQQQTIVQPKP